MKKRIALVLILATVLGCFAGCSKLIDFSNKNQMGSMPTEHWDDTLLDTVPAETEATVEPSVGATEAASRLAMIDATDLNIRSGPGTDYEVVRRLDNGDVVRVYEQQNVNGVLWGRVSDGWICLDYIRWFDQDKTDADADLESKLVGDWYRMQPEGYIEVWSFKSDGTMEYNEFSYELPDDAKAEDFSYKKGTFSVENKKLVIRVSHHANKNMPLPMGGERFYDGEKAEADLSFSGKNMYMKAWDSVVFEEGNEEKAMETVMKGESADQTKKAKVVGNWFVYEGNHRFGLWTFKDDFSYTYSYYVMDSTKEGSYKDHKEKQGTGKYCVLDNYVYISVRNGGPVKLAGRSLYESYIDSLYLRFNSDKMEIGNATFMKGKLADAENYFWETVMNGVRPAAINVVGEWYSVTSVDSGAQSLAINRHYTFYSDGTFVAERYSDGHGRYLYKDGTLVKDETAGGDGVIYQYQGTYIISGTTLTMKVTSTNDSTMSRGTYSFIMSESGGKLTLGADSYYKTSKEELGSKVFG